MSRKFFFAATVLCGLALLLSGQRPPNAPARRIATAARGGLLRDAALEQRVRGALTGAPLSFEENVGQSDPRVKFMARGSNFLLALTPQEADLRIHTPHIREKRPPQLDPEGVGWADAMAASALVRVEFAGGNPSARLEGVDPQPGTINYIKGNDPSRWRRNVPHFGRVRYEGLYPGIDAVFYGDRRHMEFDFDVAPGADPSAIRMRMEGAGSVELTEEGGVLARTPAGIVTLLPPKLYQQHGGGHQEIAGRYVWRAPGEIGFQVAPYDHTETLVIDPQAAVKRPGVRVPFANPSGGHGRSKNEQSFSPPNSPPPTGGSVGLSTFLGGSYDDSIEAIAIGPETGYVYVAGFTDSSDFPGNVGEPYQPYYGGSQVNDPFNANCYLLGSPYPCGDAFVAAFNVANVTQPQLLYTTYLGGAGDDVAWGMALDSAEDVYLVGQTNSGNFPTTENSYQSQPYPIACFTGGTQRPCYHVFFAVLNSTLSNLEYGTYLAGSDDDAGYAVAVDSNGVAFLTGIAGEYFPSYYFCDEVYSCNYNGGGDAFVASINPCSDCEVPNYGLLWATYVGGAGTDAGLAIALASGDYVFFGGVTYSTNGEFVPFPTTGESLEPDSFDEQNCGPGNASTCGDGFVAVLDPTGETLESSTFLGGSGPDQVNGLAIGQEALFVVGQTQSSDFLTHLPLEQTPPQPPCQPALPCNYAGGYDAFVVAINNYGAGVLYATDLGGSNDDIATGIALDANDDVFISGSTASGNQDDLNYTFPTLNPLQANSVAGLGSSLGTNGESSPNPTAFVSVLGPNGNLLFSTYYGGPYDYYGNYPTDIGTSIALDPSGSGNIYLAGRTTSFANASNTPYSLYGTPGSYYRTQGLCLINQVPGADLDQYYYADYKGFLVIINPTNSTSTSSGAAACFSPALVTSSATSSVPLTFNFLSTLQNTTNSQQQPQVLTIYNQGSAPLTSTIAFTGANPTDFPETDTCTGDYTVFGGGASCQISVMFKPTAVNGTAAVSESATMVITNNGNCPAAGPPCTVNLTGTSLPPATVTLTPSPYTFPGTTQVSTSSAAQAFTLTNTSTTSYVDISMVSLGGANPGDFTITGDFCTGVRVQDNNNTCPIYVAFTPQAMSTGARTATLTVTDDGASNPIATLTGTGVLAPPAVSIPPLSLTFGAQVQGTTSTAQTVTITNSAATGSQSLSVTGLTFTGGNPGDFNASGCTMAVPPGGTCMISVTFTPLAGAAGARSATLQIADNAPNTPQTIGVSGTDLALPTVSITPAPPGPVTFPAQVETTTSAPMNVTLTNTSATSPLTITSVALNGGNMGDFAIASNGCGSSLAAGANCVVAITFTPQATGARTTSLQFTDNATGSPQSVSINGTGVTAPTAVLTPAAGLTFAIPQALNTTSPSMAATLTNGGGAPLSITNITASAEFGVLSSNCSVSLAANSACTINVTFTPTASGTQMGTLTVMDAVGTQTINLMGTGVTPPTAILSTNSYTFAAPVAVNSSVTAPAITLMNTGGSALNIDSISPSGDFSESDTCPRAPTAGLAAGGMCSITVTFTPSGVGTRNGSILIVDNAANSPQTIMLSGTGSSTVPGIALSAPLFFGAVLVGNTSSPPETVTITNNGGAPLSITSVMVGGTDPGDFAAMNGCTAMVPINQTCMINVTFSPMTTGTRSATLTINDNVPSSPQQVVSLSGIGATITIAPPAGVSSTLSVLPGDTADYSLAATGTPGLVVTLNLTCTSSAPYTLCSVSPSTITLGGATPPTFTVTVLTNCNPSSVFRPNGSPPPVLPAPFAALWLGAIVLFVLLRRLAPQSRLSSAVPVLLLLLLMVTWAGCVSNPPPAIPGAPTTPAGTYSITVTATGTNGKTVGQPVQLTLRVI